MALPKLSTGALNIYADPHLGSEISPTTSPAASSKPADSDPNYTPNYEEPENGDVTVIEAEPVEPINECPTCGQPGVFRDHVIRSLVDLPIVGHPTTSCAPSTLPVHQQALLAEDLPCWPCLRARQFKDHGPGDPLDPATTLPKSDERCRCTQVIRPGVGYEVSQVLFRLMKPVFETTYGAQRTPMPKLPQHRLPHQTHDSGIHTLNPHA